MCGIIGGTISKDEIDKSLLTMRRGKDGNNVVNLKDVNIFLGFQRHAIIAPSDSESMQPIINEDETVALVMNGEIFKYGEYRTELLSKGIEFKSNGDAEVLLQLYIHDINKFYQAVAESMCAVGIVDVREKSSPKLVITRDWIGELPLHYLYNVSEKKFVFCSEIKALTNVDGYKFEDIYTLTPGHILEVDLNNFTICDKKYSLDSKEYEYKDLPMIGKELRRLMESEINVRMVADVPFCCMLSGGIDSTVTLFLIKQALGKRIKDLALYCFHVDGQKIDESSDLYHARKVAKAFGLEKNLREVIITEDEIIKALPEVVYALEDKNSKDFNVFTAIYNYFLAKRIADDGFKIAFNGEGSDEFHGSYGSWGSFVIDPSEIVKPEFRKKMAENLHKGVLMRTSKVMMYAGPIEMRSVFLSPIVANYIMNIPSIFLREGEIWKMPLVEAFRDCIPEELLRRPKQRPQDATGIMRLKAKLVNNYKDLGNSDYEVFSKLFEKEFVSKAGL